MNATDWGLLLIWIGALTTTSFVLLYGLLRPWWVSWIGRALLTSSFGLMLLFDLSVFVHYHPFTLSPTDGNAIISVAVAGACLKLFSLLLDLRQSGWRRRR